jgi:hypothetical protein
VTTADAEAFACSAVTVIAFLMEDNAPIAVRRLPADPLDAARVLAQLKQVGVEIAALAQAAISARAMQFS